MIVDNINLDETCLYNTNEIAKFIKIPENEINKDTSGENLTGGQKQKIRLMRVLSENKKIYLLDEPTNHLDQHAKDWLSKELKEKSKTSIVIVASHDSAIKDIADEFIQLDAQKERSQYEISN